MLRRQSLLWGFQGRRQAWPRLLPFQYSGEYFGDKIHGFGVYRFANGHLHEGSWHEGKKQCFGLYTFRTGKTRSGDWDCGALKNSLVPSDPAVRSAEKAALVPGVDEQVNGAVTAAVKAVQNQMYGKFRETDFHVFSFREDSELGPSLEPPVGGTIIQSKDT
ncbi:hypothetical protein C4D60_Mb10t01530 [Musa balbisiana]|uniref:MORN repeat-containing protein 5 n=1 Tax=Musa balbisiana TaxID=52838 RepID=A0A4S8IV87_MUSBA|nr:hypothetical protein C4D60_Mb10t01530 [Musa balbisiana]